MRNDSKLFAGFFGLWFFMVLLGAAFWGTVIYIVLHFVFKLW